MSWKEKFVETTRQRTYKKEELKNGVFKLDEKEPEQTQYGYRAFIVSSLGDKYAVYVRKSDIVHMIAYDKDGFRFVDSEFNGRPCTAVAPK